MLGHRDGPDSRRHYQNGEFMDAGAIRRILHAEVAGGASMVIGLGRLVDLYGPPGGL